jgi:hypothetical protein
MRTRVRSIAGTALFFLLVVTALLLIRLVGGGF